MAEFNFIQKPSFFQKMGDIYDKACGGTRLQREFVKMPNTKKICFRVVKFKGKGDFFTTKMLVFYKDSLVTMPSLTGNQIKTIQDIIKNGKGKGYIVGNKIEAPMRVKGLPDRVTPETLYHSGKFYDVNQFMKR